MRDLLLRYQLFFACGGGVGCRECEGLMAIARASASVSPSAVVMGNCQLIGCKIGRGIRNRGVGEWGVCESG